jgi:2-amino-4-hydroxy-6-hydroxymethyldihydropteridine diphosphokinase
LGSNLDHPSLQLEYALQHLEKRAGQIISRSSVYRSAPWGVTDQPEFMNQVVEIGTTQTPLMLLKCLQDIELSMGRERIIKWGSRIIDIDILYYGQEIITEPALKIPHPEIQARRFTLVPLCEIAPDVKHPVWNVSNRELLNRCTDDGAVTVWSTERE